MLKTVWYDRNSSAAKETFRHTALSHTEISILAWKLDNDRKTVG